MKKITKLEKRTIKYIVVHHCGCVCRASSSISWLNNPTNKTQASADFFVDNQGCEVYNDDIDNQYTWHCGDGARKPGQKIFNRNSIGIEMCNVSSGPNWTVSELTIKHTIELIRQLQAIWGISNENVVFHYDVSGKNCPFPATRELFKKMFNKNN